jgi:hypothetical protein
MNLSQFAPDRVPIDILIKLSVYDEDWYVQAPANAALKAMVEPMPNVLHIFVARLRSAEREERVHAARTLADIATKEPHLFKADMLRAELAILERLGDEDASRHIGRALQRVELVTHKSGYKYGI